MITFVTGGNRSGKSGVAEHLATRDPGPVVVVATAVADPSDDEFLRRIDAHRARRPEAWRTVECGAALAEHLVALCTELDVAHTVLVDAMGTWVASTPDLAVDLDAAADAVMALSEAGHHVVIVSEEVGLGLVATTEIGRRFVDVLGDVNQRLCSLADEAHLVVAGRVLPLTELPGMPSRDPR